MCLWLRCRGAAEEDNQAHLLASTAMAANTTATEAISAVPNATRARYSAPVLMAARPKGGWGSGQRAAGGAARAGSAGPSCAQSVSPHFSLMVAQSHKAPGSAHRQ